MDDKLVDLTSDIWCSCSLLVLRSLLGLGHFWSTPGTYQKLPKQFPKLWTCHQKRERSDIGTTSIM